MASRLFPVSPPPSHPLPIPSTSLVLHPSIRHPELCRRIRPYLLLWTHNYSSCSVRLITPWSQPLWSTKYSTYTCTCTKTINQVRIQMQQTTYLNYFWHEFPHRKTKYHKNNKKRTGPCQPFLETIHTFENLIHTSITDVDSTGGKSLNRKGEKKIKKKIILRRHACQVEYERGAHP